MTGKRILGFLLLAIGGLLLLAAYVSDNALSRQTHQTAVGVGVMLALIALVVIGNSSPSEEEYHDQESEPPRVQME